MTFAMEELGTEKKMKKSLSVVPWMREPVDVSANVSCPVEFLPCLDSRLVTPLQNMGITSLFPLQVGAWHKTIGPGFFEQDLCINSPTGSGKTLAYALPIVQVLSTRTIKCLRALVVLPTRQLAMQVKDTFDILAPAVGLSVGLAVGQSSIADEISILVDKPTLESSICEDFPQEYRSKVDILVATPGRLMDHINNTKGFTLEHLCYLVVDEADRLLGESYQSWLPTVLQLASASIQNPFPFGSLKSFRTLGVVRGFNGKANPRLAKIVLSATLTQNPSKLLQLNLRHPVFLTTGEQKAGVQRGQLPEHLKSFKVICPLELKPLYLLALLETLQGEKCIVFTKSVQWSHKLCTLFKFFDNLHIKMKEYSGLQHQSIRSKTMRAFREGRIQVLICSDAMARGMDVEGLKTVINYDMPASRKKYIHRAGRTARAGQSGNCFTLLDKGQVKEFKRNIEKAGVESCPEHSVPIDSIDSRRATYDSALAKLKERDQSEKPKHRLPLRRKMIK